MKEITDNPFTEDYYMRGPETGLSNYQSFSWLPDRTIPAVLRLKERLGIASTDCVLDFGCARGYMVKAFHFIGIAAYGYDISGWAIANCHPDVRGYVANMLSGFDKVAFDWIIAKDVLEHIPEPELAETIRMFLHRARKGILIVVPLTFHTGSVYVSLRDNADSTHVIRWTLCDWLKFLQRSVDDSGQPFTVNGAYKQPGLKEDITSETPAACGFLTLRRYEP